MADDVRVWEIDLSGWTTMEPIFAYQEITQGGKLSELRNLMAQHVKRWPYDSDPGQVDSYNKLGIMEWLEVSKRFGEAVGNFLRNAAESGQ
jgi:hypothetical protein